MTADVVKKHSKEKKSKLKGVKQIPNGSAELSDKKKNEKKKHLPPPKKSSSDVSVGCKLF